MKIICKTIAISSLILITACGAKTEAPATVDSAPNANAFVDVRATMPAKASPFDVHLAALHQIADDLNAIKTMDDALKMKKRIAANILVMNDSLEQYEQRVKGNKRAEVNAFRSRQHEYAEAMENYMKAMHALAEKDPKLFGIVAMELAKIAKSHG